MFEQSEKYKSLSFYAHQIVEGFITGFHRSPFHGFSVEFAEHRLYNNGESTKNIDWKLYGRTDKLFVKRFAEETNLRCHLVIDHSGSMAYPVEAHANPINPNKLSFAIYASAVLIELLARQRDAFGLSLISDNIDLHTETRSSSSHQHYLLQLLEQELMAPLPQEGGGRKTSIAGPLHLLAEQNHRRSLVVIFTDALIADHEKEELFDALRHLRHCKHEVLLFHTLDLPHEVRFEYYDRPTRFIDLESGENIKVLPSQVAQRYMAEMETLTTDIKRHAIQYGIDYQAVDIERGFDNVILPFLIKRSKHN